MENHKIDITLLSKKAILNQIKCINFANGGERTAITPIMELYISNILFPEK